jgi:hypothetical protein
MWLVYNYKDLHVYPWINKRLAPFEILYDCIVQMHYCKGMSPFVGYLYTDILHRLAEAENQKAAVDGMPAKEKIWFCGMRDPETLSIRMEPIPDV